MKNFFLFGSVALLLISGGWAVHTYEHLAKTQVDESAFKQLVVEGEKALNLGRYVDAQRIFAEELKINPKNVQAERGLRKAIVRETLSGEELKKALDELYQQNPLDGHISLFLGEYYAKNQELDRAQAYFEAAIELDPKLAEAHYVLAQLNEQRGDLNSARVEYLKAISLASEARYQNSLATIYFKQRQYEAAVKEYGKNLEYPLSSLESAKIFWRLGYLSQALNYQRLAIKWLDNEVVMAKPENQDAWYIELAPGQVVKLVTLEEKMGYAYLSLSATLFLHGNTEEAEKAVQKVRQLKLAQQAEIDTLIKSNLDTLLQGNTEVLELVDSFKKLYLQSS
ncbi:MAG: tetratricopeptide repeat protein [Methylococcaceae bacterium]|nr:tetratricopeptide repeat protein [Methylococcaceae bacterium]